MSAQVHNLPRGGAGGRAPLVPACVDVRTAKGCMFDIDYTLGSPQIAMMSNEVFGAWSRLQLRANRQEHGGTLPDDDRSLAYMAGFGGKHAIDEWTAVKPEVLEDWVLCSDGRWHHPERARNVLHIWVARRESDRKAAIGNGARSARVRLTIREIEADIRAGAEALRSLDSRDQFLLNLDGRMSKWRVPDELTVIEGGATDGNSAALRAAETPSDGGPKKSEAKRSKADSSSLLCRDDSPGRKINHDSEINGSGSSVKRTPEPSIQKGPASPWPAGWFEAFKARYPKKEAWGRAEKVLERIRKAGRVPFEEILAGIDRLIAKELPLQFTPLAATWLNDRGWEDGSPPPPSSRGRPSPRTPGNNRVALTTSLLERFHDASR